MNSLQQSMKSKNKDTIIWNMLLSVMLWGISYIVFKSSVSDPDPSRLFTIPVALSTMFSMIVLFWTVETSFCYNTDFEVGHKVVLKKENSDFSQTQGTTYILEEFKSKSVLLKNTQNSQFKEVPFVVLSDHYIQL